MNSFKERFEQGILNSIERCSYDFYTVHPDKNYICTCTEHATKQPDKKCKKCLGTGYRIKIYTARGGCNETMKGGAIMSTQTTSITRMYYIPYKYKLQEDDLIIDDNTNEVIQGNVYYVAVLNRAFGKKGYKDWYKNATRYEEDIPYEEKHFNYYAEKLGI